MTDETYNPWKLHQPRRVYENAWLSVDHHEAVTPKGTAGIYGIVRFKKVAVGVVPIERDGSIRLVGQWRVPLGRYSWELPEGGAEPGEPPERAARRELAEETGLSAGRLEEILRLDLSNSCTDETGLVYLATGLSEGRPTPDDTELLAHQRMPFAAALARVAAGEITDAISVAGILRAYHMAKSGQIDRGLAEAMLGEVP